ncbi:HIRAN domain-containing protein [Flammeovirga kamogawensis]|uniref:HIRAN domain-containing protein n=1 Tax=Flammeovirga kamogawensis TaxID=373891 RepID=A0ABX8GVJ8_9BACT|nr:HIRAN domain-containing protein [Flammeovirga kamogawensis]MBB6461036.1 hypothetical protein [Flammeovirga kamogawensis]QWG07606.1 HIRAN domain-containing protein [Flammeovirga kamogawensis]TRX69417.1 hypothetical protein EO216_15250 [Flammeovirga kamogawensis]
MVKPVYNIKDHDLLSLLQKTLLFEGFVAGYRFYSENDLEWEVMRNKLNLVRYSNNEFDENAVAVFAGDKMIGYVPKQSSKTIADCLDKGEELYTELIHVDPVAKDQKKVLFKIWRFKEAH